MGRVDKNMVSHVALKLLIKAIGKLCPDRQRETWMCNILAVDNGSNVQPKCDYLYIEE